MILALFVRVVSQSVPCAEEFMFWKFCASSPVRHDDDVIACLLSYARDLYGYREGVDDDGFVVDNRRVTDSRIS